MSIGHLNTFGDQNKNTTWQLKLLQGLQAIANNTANLKDYELVNTDYIAIAAGVGYSIGDSVSRTLVIDTPTGTVINTVFWNNTTGLQILPAPAYADLQQVSLSSSVTVTNGAGALAVNIQDGGNSITVDSLHLDVDLSTRASELTLASLLTCCGLKANEATLLNVLTTTAFQARINTLGQKTMLNSTPVVLTSDQSALPITVTALPLPTGAATEATLLLVKAKTDNLDVALSTRNLEATQLLIKAKTDNLDVALSTRATEATLATMLTLAGFQARINTLGQKTSANSTPVVLASDQSSIPVTLPVGVSRTPSIVNVPASTALTNTTAGVKQVSLRVLAGANATIGGVTVPNGTTVTYSAEGNDTVGAISYSTGAGARILISYLI